MDEHHITSANATLRTISEHLSTQFNKLCHSYFKSSQLTPTVPRYTRIADPDRGKNSTFSMLALVNSHGMFGLLSGESMCYRNNKTYESSSIVVGGKTDQTSGEADPRVLT